MGYSVKGGKLEKSGTKITHIDYIPTGYQESDAEQAARMAMWLCLSAASWEESSSIACPDSNRIPLRHLLLPA
jgi:hypothetical protein